VFLVLSQKKGERFAPQVLLHRRFSTLLVMWMRFNTTTAMLN
jgi:hypothetical protein